MAVRIVFFDWGGVLAQSNTARLLRRAGLKRTKRINQLLSDACAGRLPVFEAIRRICESSRADRRWKTLFTESIRPEAVRPRRAVWELARRIRRSGRRTGILSNNTIEWSWTILTSTPAEREFDPAIFSALESLHVGRRLIKPEAAIFRHAIQRAGVRPSEAAFLDDREENVRAARRFGLHARRFEGVGAARSWLRELGLRTGKGRSRRLL